MKRNERIAITGGIGSGKSFVADILSGMGENCISCDDLNAGLLAEKEYLAGLRKIFPDAFIGDVLDKAAVKKEIFSSEEKRRAVNEYAHKKIKERMLAEMEKYSGRIFVEVPILNQTDFDVIFDRIWVVESEKNKRVERIMKRDGVNAEFAEKQIFAQPEKYDFRVKTEFIHNDGNAENLKNQINALLREYGHDNSSRRRE
jgi:dephospho-CoA kinase